MEEKLIEYYAAWLPPSPKRGKEESFVIIVIFVQ